MTNLASIGDDLLQAARNLHDEPIELRRSIQRQGQERIRQRIEDERAETGKKGPAKFEQSVSVPTKMTTAADLDALILKLNEIKAQLALYDDIEVSFSFGSEE